MNGNASLERRILTALIAICLAVATSFAGGGFAATAAPPDDVHDVLTFEAGTWCPFALEIAVDGKAKAIEIGTGMLITTSPGLFATLTNLEKPANQVTMNITGSFRITTNPDNSVTYVVTGRNLLYDPIGVGLVLVRGNFTWTFGPDGNPLAALEGTGLVEDVCSMIE